MLPELGSIVSRITIRVKGFWGTEISRARAWRNAKLYPRACRLNVCLAVLGDRGGSAARVRKPEIDIALRGLRLAQPKSRGGHLSIHGGRQCRTRGHEAAAVH